MRYCAHIFIGKEFAEVVSGIGRAVLRNGSAAANERLHFYVADDDGGSFLFRKLIVGTRSAIDSLPGVDSEINLSWTEASRIEGAGFAEYWKSDIYNGILTKRNASGNEQLYVVLHFPFYKEKAVRILMTFYDGILAAGVPTSLDFLGYCDDLSKIIEPEYKIVSPSRRQASLFAAFRDDRHMAIDKHLVVFQNTSFNGITLGLDQSSLAEIVSQFALVCARYYTDIFPATARYRDVVSFGISTLYLDRYLFVDYLLQRTLLCAMDHSSVNACNVDLDSASAEVDRLLMDSETLLSDFYRKFDAEFAEGAESANVQQYFRAEATEIIERCKKVFLDQPSITFKAAIVAIMLSKTECELFSQTAFNPAGTTMDDLFSEAMDYFIEHDKAGVYMLDDQPPRNPIGELRLLNNKLLNSESEVRSLQRNLAALEKQLEDVDKVEECCFEKGFYCFGDQKFRLLPHWVEEPLSATYSAHDRVAPSVDLRSKFTAVKNQGQQGSCLAHALTAVFEYVLKINQAPVSNLSEAFLYYNARNLDKTGDVSVSVDAGSRFHSAIESLIAFGLAQERFCPYIEGAYDRRPSEEAYRDAAARKLVQALNVGRTSHDIKSALSDGFPVVVSLMLCKSFCPAPGGYIPMPECAEIEAALNESNGDMQLHAHHAMVIVGYSDSLKMFVVRNSWGGNWGDGGYCYIPYAYIDHPDLCSFACILTEIESLSVASPEQVALLKVDSTDLTIQYHLTRASYDNELEALGRYRRDRDELRYYFEKLKSAIASDPNKRDEYIERNVALLDEERQALGKERDSVRSEMRKLEDGFGRHKTRVIFCSLVAVCLLWGVFYGYNRWLCIDESWRIGYGWLSLLYGVLALAVFIWSNRHWRRYRESRDDYEAKMKRLNRAIAAKTSEIGAFKAKTFAAWNLLRAMNRVQSYLQSQYNYLISLINNLRAWYREIEMSHERTKLETDLPNTSLLDKKILDAFFERWLENEEISRITFSEGIENHEISESYLQSYKKNLLDKLMVRLVDRTMLASFDITEQAVEGDYSEISLPITRELIAHVDAQSDLFMQIQSLERPEIMRSSCICAPSLDRYETKFGQVLRCVSDCYLQSEDKNRIVFVKTAALQFDECVVLRPERDVSAPLPIL